MMQRVLGTNLTAEQRDLLRMTASKDIRLRRKYRRALAQVLEGAFRAAVLEEDSIGSIYQTISIAAGADVKFPLHFLPPGAEEDRVAWVMPKEGAIPHRFIEGDEVYVPTYELANSIDWPLRYARDARWDVVADAMDVFRYGFTRKKNDDGWHTLLASAIGNGRIVDTAAAQGAFTKRLITNLMTGIRRLTGGRASRVTDIYLSPEAMADIRNWTDTEVDEITRREIFVGPNPGGLPSIFGIALHELQELGDGQRYQDWMEDSDGGNQSGWFTTDDEFCVALDLRGRANYPFKMPLREDLGVFDDESLHRSARMGVYGWMELGFVVLDARYALIGTF
jgi:hypothetical protein